MDVSADRVVIGERVLVPGEVITIDGRTGEVFDGVIPGTTEVVPEARTLLAWAADLGIDVGAGSVPENAPADASPASASASSPARTVTPDLCLRVIAIKGFALLPGIADAVLADAAAVEPILDQLAIDGLVASSAGAIKLTDAGTERAASLLEADRAAWGKEAANTALDAFLELDDRVKDTVTAWQLRDAECRRHQRPHRPRLRRRRPRAPGDARRGGVRLVQRRTRRTRPARGLPHPAGAGARASAGWRWSVRRITAGRQLSRHLVRAPRGPDRARRPHARRGGRGRPRLIDAAHRHELGPMVSDPWRSPWP